MPDITLIAGVIVRNEKRQYLLVQEAKPHVYGSWNWPAGHVEAGETLQQAAIREAKEETNFDVRIIAPEPIYKGQGDAGTTNMVHLFRAEIAGGELRSQAGELLDARWFSANEIRQLAKTGKARGEPVIGGLNAVEGMS